MVITFRKPMSHGLEFTANYTLSKAVDGGQVAGNGGTFNGTDYILDPRNKKLEYGLSDLDQRHRFVGSLVWAPSFAKKIQNKATRLILDGLSFSTIVVGSTGQPIQNGTSGGVGAQINGFPSGGADGGLTGGSVNNSGTGIGGRIFGPRNPFTGPGYNNVDFRIGRQFAYRERLKLASRRRGVQSVQLHELLHGEQYGVQLLGGGHGRLRGPHERLPGGESVVHGAADVEHECVGRAPVADLGEDHFLVNAARRTRAGFRRSASPIPPTLRTRRSARCLQAARPGRAASAPRSVSRTRFQ